MGNAARAFNMMYGQILMSSFVSYQDLMYGKVSKTSFGCEYDYLVKEFSKASSPSSEA